MAIRRAGIEKNQIDIVSAHATGTSSGDAVECEGLRSVFENCPNVRFNGAKGHIGHCMGAAAALELHGADFRRGFIKNNIDGEEDSLFDMTIVQLRHEVAEAVKVRNQ